MARRLVFVAAVVGLAACSKQNASPPVAGELTPVPMLHPLPPPLPDPENNGGHVGRAPRRITVAQLKQSIAVTTGRQWTQIDALAASLGAADYALVNSEAVEPNLVFAKFLEDGAREVCLNAARDDLARAPAARLLYPEVPDTRDFTTLTEAAIQKNLGYLSVRFWGQPMASEELGTWTTTFRAIATAAKTANKPEQAWGAMCIALMIDPRFITY
jgi:hypothetical protein